MTHLLGGTLWSENMQAHCAFAAYSEIFDPLVLGKEFACDSVGVGRRPLERPGTRADCLGEEGLRWPGHFLAGLQWRSLLDLGF